MLFASKNTDMKADIDMKVDIDINIDTRYIEVRM